MTRTALGFLVIICVMVVNAAGASAQQTEECRKLGKHTIAAVTCELAVLNKKVDAMNNKKQPIAYQTDGKPMGSPSEACAAAGYAKAAVQKDNSGADRVVICFD